MAIAKRQDQAAWSGLSFCVPTAVVTKLICISQNCGRSALLRALLPMISASCIRRCYPAAPRFALHGTSKTVLHCLADSCLRFLVRAPLHRISCFFARARHLSAISEISSCVRCSIPINAFSILGVLNNEHHQKRDDRRPCIDNQLPGVGVMENGACDSPHDDNECCKQKRNRSPRLMGDSGRDVGESALHLSQKRPPGNLFPRAIASAR